MDVFIQTATSVFEAKVIQKNIFFDSAGWPWVYNLVNITKVIHGDVHCGLAEIITWDDSFHNASCPLLKLIPGNKGIFMCQNLRKEIPALAGPKDNPQPLETVGDISSFFKYGITNNIHGEDSSMFYFDHQGRIRYWENPRAAFRFFDSVYGHPYTVCAMDSTVSSGFSYYPNPTAGKLTLRIPGHTSAAIIIYNETGQAVYNLNQPLLQAGNLLEFQNEQDFLIQTIDLECLSPGFYMGQAVVGTKVYGFKVVKE